MRNVFMPTDILLPKKGTDMTAWSVVACDQYTSDRKYWERVEKTVGDKVSTLKLILPEIYLEDGNVAKRTDKINETMKEYLENGVFEENKNCYIYTERTLSDGKVRKGIIGAVDLEKYDFSKGSTSEIRATEGTVLERIPPRVKIRENAPLELPHIMILIDDPEDTVMSAVGSDGEKRYDFTLMENGGKVSGRIIDGNSDAAKRIDEALEKLESADLTEKKYNIKAKPLPYAVGDGNHSLATAKTCYLNGGSRYALVEFVNLHDASLDFEAIHRNVFDVDPEKLLEALEKTFGCKAASVPTAKKPGRQYFTYVTNKGDFYFEIENPTKNLAVGTVQEFLDGYPEGKTDYIHGEDAVRNNINEKTVGFLFDTMKKEELFPTVIKDGALPRKTFSMGHAHDKRFYLEARKIRG